MWEVCVPNVVTISVKILGKLKGMSEGGCLFDLGRVGTWGQRRPGVRSYSFPFPVRVFIDRTCRLKECRTVTYLKRLWVWYVMSAFFVVFPCINGLFSNFVEEVQVNQNKSPSGDPFYTNRYLTTQAQNVLDLFGSRD